MAAKNWPTTFINELAETSNVAAACKAAGISQACVYKKRRDDPDFARRWFEALSEGYDRLEMELLARLRSGRLEDTDEEGNRRKFDIGTAFRCLAAHRENVLREKGRKLMSEEVATIAAINAKIDAMRAREERAAALEAKREARRAHGQ